MRKNHLVKSEEELKRAILKAKESGTSDVEIGQKFGVSFRYIEKVITEAKGVNVSNFKARRRIKHLEPKNFRLERTSVWSFRQRGDWATHSGEYRGNFSPYIPRNIILRYSKPGDLVLDMFCGAGTTAIEAKLLGRKCIASDINEKAIALARENLNFRINRLIFPDSEINQFFEPELLVRDARDLSFLPNRSVDLICTHPPYANIIQYTDNQAEDLSYLDVDAFLEEMKKVARESFRVLKPGRQCALLIGDTRRKRHIVPLGFRLINVFLETGFALRELIIKRQHNCKTTGFWYEKSIKNNFLLLAHEYLPVFEKPEGKNMQRGVAEKTASLNVHIKQAKPRGVTRILETTTVWIFPEKEREEFISQNLIRRYADEGNYAKFELGLDGKATRIHLKEESNKLVWVCSEAFQTGSNIQPEEYLSVLRSLVQDIKTSLVREGYLAIETQDVRFGSRLVPMAKLVVDTILDKELWLKEIVVVTTEKPESGVDDCKNNSEYLGLVHGYILIYEKL